MSLDWAALSDGELAALSLAGRQAAFGEIVRRHRAPVFRLIRGMIGDPEEALDLSQDTFLAAHVALRRYDEARPMRTWLCAIAINKCRDLRRKRFVRRLMRPVSASDAVSVADDGPTPDRSAADRQALSAVERHLADLPPSLKEPLVLRAIEGLSQAETAALLGLSEKAVETRVRRARLRLSEKLAVGRGGGPSKPYHS